MGSQEDGGVERTGHAEEERGKNLEAMSIFCLSTLVIGCTYPRGAVLAVGR